MKILASPRTIDFEEENTSASWGIRVNHDGSLDVYAYGITYRDRDNYDCQDEGGFEIPASGAGDFFAAMQAWMEQLK